MSERFEIQARRQHRREGAVVRDESRLAHAEKLNDALKTANVWVDEGFTVWVYRVDHGNGVNPIYHAVQTFQPPRRDEQVPPSTRANRVRPYVAAIAVQPIEPRNDPEQRGRRRCDETGEGR